MPCSKIGKAARRWLAAVLLAALAGPGFLSAAEPASATAGLVDPTVEAGQPAEYHIEVTNSGTNEPPPAPEVEGLSITYAGSSQSTQMTGGFSGGFRTTVTYIYIYSIETTRPGRFVIPGQDVPVGHGTIAVGPVVLNVTGPGGTGAGNGSPGAPGASGAPARQSYFAELIIPKKTAYVGESIPIEVRVYFGADVRAQIDPNPILNGDGFSVRKFTAPQQSAGEVEGARFNVITYKSALTGVKTGSIAIGPAEVSPVVRVPRAAPRRRSTFNDPFDQGFFNDPFGAFNQAPPKQVTLRTDPVTIEIKPLPPGKPADFSGAIGQFTLLSEADPRKAATGDPVTMRLSLQGQGNFDRIEPPRLADETGLRTYPPNAKFKADDDVGMSGLKTFDQVVIADSARTSLPGYHLSYLDPASGAYLTLKTPPVAVAITGAPVATPVPASTAASQGPTPTATPARRAEDILYIRDDFGPARARSDFLPLSRRALFWKIQGALLVLILAAGALFQWWLWRRGETARQAAAWQRLRASLSRTLREENTGREAFYSAARRLAQLQAAAAMNRPGAQLTPGEISEARQLSPDEADSVTAIFHRHEELAYSGRAKAEEPVPAAERRAVLATLETLGRN